MIPATQEDNKKASIGFAEEVTINEPTAKEITIITGKKKFQNKLVFIFSYGLIFVSSTPIRGFAPSAISLFSLIALYSAFFIGP